MTTCIIGTQIWILFTFYYEYYYEYYYGDMDMNIIHLFPPDERSIVDPLQLNRSRFGVTSRVYLPHEHLPDMFIPSCCRACRVVKTLWYIGCFWIPRFPSNFSKKRLCCPDDFFFSFWKRLPINVNWFSSGEKVIQQQHLWRNTSHTSPQSSPRRSSEPVLAWMNPHRRGGLPPARWE